MHSPRVTTLRCAAFTMVEAIVGITLAGIGIACCLSALTMINSMASTSRNATGAYTAVMNQIDLILSDGPFNPQKTNADGSPQIPPELQLGTHTQNNVSIYKEPTTGVVVSGTMTTSVTDVSTTFSGLSLSLYQATVTVNYTYRNRNYSFSMSTVRSSDI
jgi:type II secretory pathway pseudopilin PulG